MKRSYIVLLAALAMLLAACSSKGQIMDGDGMLNSYKQISQDEAKEMMARDDGHVVVDVRRQDEYDAGHIPGAILIPNESIGTEKPEALPDLDQIILIYCRSGNRSKQAAQKLFDMGYKRIYEFGGINTWTGEIVTSETTTNGGGSDEAETAAPESTEFEETANAIRPVPTLVIQANDKVFYAGLEDNSSAEAFTEKLSSEAIEVEMHDYGSFEKVGSLPWSLPKNDDEITTGPGDVILYQGNQITIYYDRNTWSFTRMAKISDVTREELLEAFGDGNVTVKFWIEWSE